MSALRDYLQAAIRRDEEVIACVLRAHLDLCGSQEKPAFVETVDERRVPVPLPRSDLSYPGQGVRRFRCKHCGTVIEARRPGIVHESDGWTEGE